MERIGILLLIYLLPYRDFPLIIKEPVSIRLFDVGILLCSCILVLLIMLNKGSYKINIHILISFVLFEIWMCITSFIGSLNDGSQSIITRYLILVPYSFLIYYIAYIGVLRAKISWFMRHLIISLVIASTTAYILMHIFPEVVLRWSAGINLDDKGFKVTRFAGFGSEPNYWGNLFLFLLPLSIAGIISRSIRDELRLNLTILLLLVSFAALTFSIFTHIAIILSFISILLINSNNINKYKLTTIMLALILFIGLFGHNYIVYFFSKSTTLTTSSSFERFYWAYSAVKMWLESPIIGHGLGTYVNHYQDYISFAQVPIAEQANSVFFATLAEQGVLGFAFLIMILVTISGFFSWKVIRIYRSHFLLKFLVLGILLYVPYFLITGTLYLYYFWFYAGALGGFIQREASKLHDNYQVATTTV